MKRILVGLLILAGYSFAFADRFEYSADVNQHIPELDSAGVRDTIIIPDHIQIDDINFYVGVGRVDQPWAENVLVCVYSPERHLVFLNNWASPRIYWYDVWYDTDRQVDGPGNLEDYNGQDAYGPWEMYCFDPFEGNTLDWYNWRIEVYGTPLTSIQNEQSGIPNQFMINNIYPNPFNAQTSIEFGLPEAAEVKVEIFDILGRNVAMLSEGRMSAGYHQIIWKAAGENDRTVASGIYLMRVTAGEKSLIRKVTLLK